MIQERRKYRRFSATAFLNRPVQLMPLPPYFGHSVRGKLIDLSAGGMSILINELIPQSTFLSLKITFPDHSLVECIVKVKRIIPRAKNFVHGIEFLNLSPAMVERIDKMSVDYINCEGRINTKADPICKTDCAFFTMCSKEEKIDPILDVDRTLTLSFEKIANIEQFAEISAHKE